VSLSPTRRHPSTKQPAAGSHSKRRILALAILHSTHGVGRRIIPVTNVVTQAAEIDRTISQEGTFAKLCTGFAVLALLIACVGLYGTMSHSVARQVGEIGIRTALGAQRGAVVWMVLRRVLLLAAVGLAISVPAALSASQLVKSFLFETQPNDPEIPDGRCRPPKRRDSRWLWTSKASVPNGSAGGSAARVRHGLSYRNEG
jgi:ABC-type antimicrobial peptide transport system permease subunit